MAPRRSPRGQVSRSPSRSRSRGRPLGGGDGCPLMKRPRSLSRGRSPANCPQGAGEWLQRNRDILVIHFIVVCSRFAQYVQGHMTPHLIEPHCAGHFNPDTLSQLKNFSFVFFQIIGTVFVAKFADLGGRKFALMLNMLAVVCSYLVKLVATYRCDFLYVVQVLRPLDHIHMLVLILFVSRRSPTLVGIAAILGSEVIGTLAGTFAQIPVVRSVGIRVAFMLSGASVATATLALCLGIKETPAKFPQAKQLGAAMMTLVKKLRQGCVAKWLFVAALHQLPIALWETVFQGEDPGADLKVEESKALVLTYGRFMGAITLFAIVPMLSEKGEGSVKFAYKIVCPLVYLFCFPAFTLASEGWHVYVLITPLYMADALMGAVTLWRVAEEGGVGGNPGAVVGLYAFLRSLVFVVAHYGAKIVLENFHPHAVNFVGFMATLVLSYLLGVV